MKPWHLLIATPLALLLATGSARAQPLHVWPSPLQVEPDAEGRVEFDLVVVNTSERAALNVSLVDELAPGAELVRADPPARADRSRQQWGLGEIAPGGAVKVRLVIEDGTDLGATVAGLVGSTQRARQGPAVRIFAGPGEVAEALRPTLDADAADPEVLALVSRLEGDPDALLSYVAERIAYEPYRGSLRGARGTLRSGAGNAWDQASLAVALLRAAGVPARYARATLDEALAADLIAAAFSAPGQALTPTQPPAEVLQAVNDQQALAALLGPDFAAAVADVGDGLGDILYPDPTRDPELLAVAAEHVFVEHRSGEEWRAADPARAAAPPAAEQTFVEIDDGLRHRVDVSVSAEVLNPAFGFPGGGGSERLRVELRSVQLSGRTLALRHRVYHDIHPGLIYSSVAHTYLPTLELDGQVVAQGEAYRELFTNYPAASEVLTGLFVDVRRHGPGAEPVDYRHPVVDRLGAAVRDPGPDGASVQLEGLQGQPAVTNLDVTVIHAPASLTTRLAQRRADHALAKLTAEANRLAPEMEALVSLGEQDLLSFEEQLLLEARSELYGELHVALGQSLGEDFLRRSEQADRALAEHLRLTAFAPSAKLLFVDLRGAPGGPGARVDVADMSVRVLGPAELGAGAARTFATTRGLVQSMLEGEILGPLALREHAVVSLGSVFDAAQQQGVALRTIAADNVIDELLRLDLPPEALARIRSAVSRDRAVLTPERPVWVGDRQQLVWLEYDGHTGELIAVGPDGHHVASVEWANVAENVLTFGMGFVMGAVAGYYMGIAVACVQVLEQHVGGQGKLAPYPAWAPITCFWPAAGIPGYALFEAIENGAIVSMLMKVGIFHLLGKFTEFIAKEAAGGKGLASFIYGMKVGVCVGFMAARQTVAALLQALDPPLSPLSTAFGERLVLPVGLISTWPALPAGEEPRALPDSPLARPVRVTGTLSLSWSGWSTLPGGALRVEGEVVGADGSLGPGPHEVDAAWLELEGPLQAEGAGSLVAYPGGEAVAEFAYLQAQGAAVSGWILGTVRGEASPDEAPGPSWLRVVQADVELSAARGGAAALPPEVDLQVSHGTLSLGPEAFAGLDGALALREQGVQLDGSAQRSLRLADGPRELELERGASGAVAFAPLSSAPCSAELSAEGPAGWDLRWEETTLHVTPAPGAAAGPDHLVSVQLACDDTPDAAAGLLLPVRIADGAGVTLGLSHAPLFTTPAGANQAPLVFRAELVHQGPEPAVYRLEVETSEGFEPTVAADELTLQPGERGAAYLSVNHTGELPAPDSPLIVSVEAQSEGAPARAELQWSYPALFGSSARFAPDTLQLEPAQQGMALLRLEATGNTPGELTLLLQAPDALEVLGLPERVQVEPGATLELPVQIRLAADATPGLPHIAAVRMLRGEVVEGATLLRVDAIGPEANSAVAAAALADEMGDAELRDALLGVAARIEQASFRCDNGDVHYLGQALGVLLAELSDPAFVVLREALIAQQASLAEEGCASFDLAALAATLRDLLPLLEALRDHDFRVALAPDGLLLTPGDDGHFLLQVERLGALETTVALALEGVPGEVASPVAPDPLVEDHPVLVHAAPGRSPFRVVAHAVEAPVLRREVSAVVVSEAAWVQVVSLGAEPAFAVPGAQLRVAADLLNVPNLPQELEGWLRLERPDGSLAWQNEEPIPLTLPAAASLRRHPLATVPTFGEAPGAYRLHVALHAPGGAEPVGGGVGEGTVLLGAPLDARTLAEAPSLPPGESSVAAVTEVHRRRLNVLPGVGNPSEISIFATDTAGPAGLVGHADGSVYFTSFGTERSSDIPGYEAGRTVGRISAAGEVGVVATVAPAVAGLALHPAQGDLYAANVGNPERVTRVTLPEGADSVYYEFETQPVQGGGNGENVTGLVFDAAGNLYATELIEPGLFVTYPGERIYRLTPDADGDGRADLAETYVTGLSSPTDITIDPRTGDLFVCDTGHDRVARVTTSELEPELTTAVEGFDQCQGLEFDAAGNLFVVNDTLGEIHVWATEVVEGHTELVQPGQVLLQGLRAPYNLAFGANGDLVTALVDEDTVLRILIDDPAPAPEVDLTVTHAARPTGLDRDSAGPELGPDGPTWGDDSVQWTTSLPPNADEEQLRFSVQHRLQDLKPGATVQLSDGGLLRYTVGGATHEAELPPVVVAVEHLVGLAPDRLDLRQGTPGRATVTLHNRGAEEETYGLEVEGLPPGVAARLPSEVSVPAGGSVDVELWLTADASVPLGSARYAVRATSAAGHDDRVVATLDVIGEGFSVDVAVEPAAVYRGEQITVRMRFAKGEGDGRRGFDSATRGLSAITSNRREVGGLVDFLRGPVVEFERTTTLVGPAGTYPFQLHIWEGSADNVVGRATAQVTILDQHGVTVGADPPVVRTGRGQPFTLTAVLHNDGRSARRVRLGRCCGPVYWQPAFDEGPHELGPGATLRVPIRMWPNGILVGDYGHRLDATDLDDPALNSSFTATVRVEEPGGTLRLLDPRHAVAEQGTAVITARLDRAYSSPGARYRVEVSGPLTAWADPVSAEVDLTASWWVQVPFHFRGIDELGPGPWSVRVRAWPVDDPGIVFEEDGSVAIPTAGVNAAFDPPALTVPLQGEPTDAVLVVRNHDLGAGAEATVRLSAAEGALLTEPEAGVLPLAPGQRRMLPVSVVGLQPGDHSLLAEVSASADEAPQTSSLAVRVLDPARAPRIDDLLTVPAPPLEGLPFELVVLASDPQEEPLTYDADLDGDGVWEIDGWPEGRFPIQVADDGPLSVAVRVRDREGGSDEAEATLQIANVAPEFTTLPPPLATHGQLWEYRPELRDPGADTVVLDLTGPAGAELEQGLVRWIPDRAAARVGEADFMLRAEDEDGGQSEQAFTVRVRTNNQPPAAPTPVAPVEGEVVGVRVRLEVAAAADPEQDPLTYLFEIVPPGDAPRWQVQSAEESVEIELEGPGLHAWRARADDGLAAGPFSVTETFEVDPRTPNRPPGAPEITSPEADAGPQELPVTLAWVAAEDPEGDPLTYDLQVALDGGFERLLVDERDLGAELEGDDATLRFVVPELVGGARYHARVRAVDPHAAGAWAERLFDTDNRAPGLPTQISPLDGVTVEAGPVALQFETTDDPDGHALTYVVAVLGSPDAVEPLWTDTLALQGPEGVAQFPAPEAHVAYLWTVTAVDELGLAGATAGPEEFVVGRPSVNQAPSAPTLLEPADGAEAVVGQLRFVMAPGVDPEGEGLTHTLTVWDARDEVALSIVDLRGPGRIEVLAELFEPGSYAWSARATDARGLEGPAAGRRSLSMLEPAEPDLGPQPEPDLGPQPEPDLGPRPEPDLGTEPAQDLGPQPEPDLGLRPQDGGLDAGPDGAGARPLAPTGGLADEGCACASAGATDARSFGGLTPLVTLGLLLLVARRRRGGCG